MRKVIENAILAATDLSEASDEVLRAAALLARRTGARLHVIHAFDFPPSPYLEQFPDSFQDHLELSEKALKDQIARAVPDDVLAVTRLEIFAPHRAIADYADAIHADVVVMGPHSRRAIGLFFLGSTVDRVLRTVAAPVLIVRGPLAVPLAHVLAPIDLSEHSGGALDAALAWTAALRAGDSAPARLDIVHVVPKMLASPTLPFDKASVLPGMNREVEAALERAGGAGGVDVHEEMVWAERADDGIVEYAKENGAQLAILSTHGYGGIRRALIGSVATAVARSAPCPVLLVPPKLWRNEAPAHEPAEAGASAAYATAGGAK